jgi:hypothetical protein
MKRILLSSFFILIFSFISLGAAEREIVNPAVYPGRISIEGTYKFSARKLADGTKIKPPQITGLLVFTEKYRQLNLSWTDDNGKLVSVSCIAEYTLDDEQYTEKNMFYCLNTETEGSTYDMSDLSASSEVTTKDGKISFTLPIHDKPLITVTKDILVAEGQEYTDYWKKVE